MEVRVATGYGRRMRLSLFERDGHGRGLHSAGRHRGGRGVAEQELGRLGADQERRGQDQRPPPERRSVGEGEEWEPAREGLRARPAAERAQRGTPASEAPRVRWDPPTAASPRTLRRRPSKEEPACSARRSTFPPPAISSYS